MTHGHSHGARPDIPVAGCPACDRTLAGQVRQLDDAKRQLAAALLANLRPLAYVVGAIWLAATLTAVGWDLLH